MGFVAGICTIAWVLYSSLHGGDTATLFNVHSILIVGVGTIGIFLISTPRDTLRALWAVAKNGASPTQTQPIHAALLELTRSRSANVRSAHPLIARASELWEQGVDPTLFDALIERRAEGLELSSAKAVTAIKNLAKYPPALGMTGTVMGLVGLFSQLTPEKKGMIGPNLAMAMTATFYGLILSNMVIMPLGDRLHVRHLEQAKLNEHILKALLLINRGEARSVIEGEMRVYAA